MMKLYDSEECVRCGRRFDADDPELSDGEATSDGYVCADCLTAAAERQGLDESALALEQAMTDAGLGADADVEAMSEDEYEMRDSLANRFYEQESTREP